ncbi:MAG: ATP-binding protein, partial [Acidobacteria bacterium]|nr:ATP-binding protein [Acidobacteriota bacterium]
MKRRRIGDLVSVTPRPTVVRLDDLEGERREWIVAGYHLTPEVERFLTAMEAWLGQPHGGGGFLIGAYGSGKSHFLAYLTTRLRAGELGPDPPPEAVTLSLVNFSAGAPLEEIVASAVGLEPGGGDRREAWAAVAERFPHGLLLLMDELSEFLRSKPNPAAFNEDVRFLQFLGEWARDNRLWVLAALQEEMEHTGRLESAVYRKIKDRYPLRLVLSPAHVRNLVADHLLLREPGFEEAMDRLAEELQAALGEGAIPPGELGRLYPVAPATLELLEEVRDIFSQTRGAVDLVVTRLLGDAARDIEPFLDRPWGQMLTPDIIVDHFQDLFELQPELLPIAQRFLPYYRKNMDRLFASPRQRELAWRVLKLLVVTHLSPERKGLAAREAASWLAIRATTVAPAKNVAIAQRILGTLASEGAFVREDRGRYTIDLADEGSQALERLLPREVAELQGATPEAVWEELAALSSGEPFDPFSLPRDRWRLHTIRWHFHERQVAFFFGAGMPPAPPVPLGFVLRPPWSEAGAAPGTSTILPRRLELEPGLLELAALLRLRRRAGAASLRELLERRIAHARPALLSAVQGAYLEAILVDAEGTRHTPPRPSVREPFVRWLDQLALWLLRRRYPSFEGIAPTAGPLPKEAYRRFVDLAVERGLDAESDDETITVIREGYLVPMGLLRREGWYAVPETKIDRNELVKLVRPVLDSRPSPRALAEHLQDSVFGLVPDQVELLLVFLLLLGEIDIVKGRRSYRELFHAMPLPTAYDTVVPAEALPTAQTRALEELCQGLGIRRPQRWSALELGSVLDRLRRRAREDRTSLKGALTALGREEDTATLRERITAHLSVWSVLETGDAPVRTLERFLAAAPGVRQLLAERGELLELPGRLGPLLERRRRLSRLLEHPHLDASWDEAIRSRLGAVGAAPSLARLGDLAAWVQEAGAAYEAYALAYRKRHESYWESLAQHPVWSWQPPAVAGSRHLDLDEALAALEAARNAAGRLRCAGLVDPDLGPRCACGFDGIRAPIEEELEAFDAARRSITSTVEGFFAQDRVREAVRSWVGEGLEVREGAVAYLEDRTRVPEITDVALFDRHLAGAELVKDLSAGELLQGLEGRPMEPGALLEALGQRLRARPGDRVRILAAGGSGEDRLEIGRWCLARCLESGVPLPDALAGALPPGAPRWLEPARIAPEALRRLDALGLGAEVEEEIAAWIARGDLTAPDAGELCPLTLAARETARPTRGGTAAGRAGLARALYTAHPRMLRAAPEAWRARLDALATDPLDEELPELYELLREAADSQWLVVDCLGLPLLPALEAVIEQLLAPWSLHAERFALVEPETTTARYWSRLAEEGLDHPMLKLNAVDRLLHERRLELGELERLAAAELGVGLGRLTASLNAGRPVLVFADHGFRL